jgi:hypothetical protein
MATSLLLMSFQRCRGLVGSRTHGHRGLSLRLGLTIKRGSDYHERGDCNRRGACQDSVGIYATPMGTFAKLWRSLGASQLSGRKQTLTS